MLESMPNIVFWIGVAVICGLLELATVGFFFIFLAGGALLTALFAFFVPSIPLQAAVFLLASTLLTLLARPVLRKTLNVGDKPIRPSNVQALEGAEVLVLQGVDRYQGEVKVLSTGERWTARLWRDDSRNDAEELLKKGTLAEVVQVEGARLEIRRKSESKPVPAEDGSES